MVAEAGPSDLKAFSTAMASNAEAMKGLSSAFRIASTELSLPLPSLSKTKTQKKARKEKWRPTADMLAASAPAALLLRARKGITSTKRKATERNAPGTRTIAGPLALPQMAYACPVVQSLMDQLSTLLGDYSPSATERASQRGCCVTRYCLRLGRSTNTIGLAGFELLHPIGRTYWYD